jgi:hypothetical protein
MSPIALAQGETEIWTDKATYQEGEVMLVTLKVSNPDQTTYTWTTHCNKPTLDFDGLHLDYTVCSTYTEPFQFTPGSWRSWTFTLQPNVLGLPQTNGEHELVVYFAHLSDTVHFSAPMYLGGRVQARISLSANPDSVAAARDALQATVISSREWPNIIEEVWEIVGMTIEEADAAYDGPDVDVRIIERTLDYVELISVDLDRPPEIPARTSVEVYPNPFKGSSTVHVRTNSTGHVSIEILDLAGRRVATAFDGLLRAGSDHEFTLSLDGRPSGLYIWRVVGERRLDSGMIAFIK